MNVFLSSRDFPGGVTVPKPDHLLLVGDAVQFVLFVIQDEGREK